MVRIEVHSQVGNTPYVRSFENYNNLLKTAYFEGEFRSWWDDSVVRFEDGKSSSSSMVEVIYGRTVTVGVPSYYVWFCFDSYKNALQAADKVAQAWLDWEDKNNFRKFVDQVEIEEE